MSNQPIAWGMPRPDGAIIDCITPEEHAREPGEYTVPLYTQPKAEPQEPVAWMWKDGTVTSDPDRADGTWTPLYTAPQPRKRLTDEEITLAMMRVEEQGQGYFLRLARAIEAAVWGETK